MAYSPTFTIKNQPNVGKYTIHRSHGYGNHVFLVFDMDDKKKSRFVKASSSM